MCVFLSLRCIHLILPFVRFTHRLHCHKIAQSEREKINIYKSKRNWLCLRSIDFRMRFHIVRAYTHTQPFFYLIEYARRMSEGERVRCTLSVMQEKLLIQNKSITLGFWWVNNGGSASAFIRIRPKAFMATANNARARARHRKNVFAIFHIFFFLAEVYFIIASSHPAVKY